MTRSQMDLDEWTVSCLARVPVSDVNFKGARDRATLSQARRALALAEGKTKIAVLQALIRSLEKKALRDPPHVGEIWTFKVAWMGNPAHTPALCYEVYELRENGKPRPGWSFIFPNGEYCGYSPDDMTIGGGRKVREIPALAGYVFTNVGQLTADFRRGVFAEAFTLIRR